MLLLMMSERRSPRSANQGYQYCLEVSACLALDARCKLFLEAVTIRPLDLVHMVPIPVSSDDAVE